MDQFNLRSKKGEELASNSAIDFRTNESFDIDLIEDLLFSLQMGWTKPEHSIEEINKSGMVLIDKHASFSDYENALIIIDNFRASHNFPLNTMQVWLRHSAKSIDNKCIVVQRIKRLSSIKHKLRRMSRKKIMLSEMQDIGGCRAIMACVEDVRKLEIKYKESSIRHKLAYPNDYITYPRKSGYRGMHIIYEYYSNRSRVYNGQRIEIQIRSPLQHAWATAVEAVDTFTRQVLKFGGGKEDWKRFFQLTGSSMALREKMPLVPDTPQTRSNLQHDLLAYGEQIETINKLKIYGKSLHQIRNSMLDARYILLKLDSNLNQVEIRGFAEEKKAMDEYLNIERKEDPSVDSVLVSTKDIDSLQRAYPNYFLDIDAFCKFLENFLGQK